MGLVRALTALHLVAVATVVPFVAQGLPLLAVVCTGLGLAGIVLFATGGSGPRADPAEATAVTAGNETPEPAGAGDPEPRPERVGSEVLGIGTERVLRIGCQPADLMGRISHEIRTPLNAVIGFSDLMGAELFGPLGSERYRDYVRHIRASGHELLKSAEDTLALTCALTNPAMSPSGAADAVPLAALARESFAFAAETVAPGAVDLDCRIAADIDVLADRRALRQILINLFEEAVDRAGGSGRIRVEVEADACIVQVEISAQSDRPGAADTGLRIAVARTLLEFYQSGLIVLQDSCGRWRAVTALDRAAQPDFFATETAIKAATYPPRAPAHQEREPRAA
ncbi:MAG: HAMP domain-containing sensor histidine kinase [Hyphomicrobiaceae bacterium]|nr:HAMP domain-containing sensor histidine kinase [Hyphomicrobiaceae bacterium]